MGSDTHFWRSHAREGAGPLTAAKHAVRRLRRDLSDLVRFVRYRDSQRVFCVGFNKTGTTSLARALRDLGFCVGDQRRAERLIDAWAVRDFRPIIRYCRGAEAFQDIPFSLPYTFQALDMAFPGSRFVLSVRDSADQWYRSLTRFHAKMFGGGMPPIRGQLESASYCEKGWIWKVNRLRWPTPEDDPYNEAILKGSYLSHIQDVREYFKNRGDLLVINVAEPGSYREMCQFLGRDPLYESFPWENQTGT